MPTFSFQQVDVFTGFALKGNPLAVVLGADGIRGTEDPVTGSLNAGLAQWLIGAGLAPNSFIASQGTVLDRDGRVHVDKVGDDIRVGGRTVTCVGGRLTL